MAEFGVSMDGIVESLSVGAGGFAASLPVLIGICADVLEVFRYSLGVADHLVAVDEHGHALLAGQLLDLGALAAALRHALRAVLDPELGEPALDGAAGTQNVRRHPAAIEHHLGGHAPMMARRAGEVGVSRRT